MKYICSKDVKCSASLENTGMGTICHYGQAKDPHFDGFDKAVYLSPWDSSFSQVFSVCAYYIVKMRKNIRKILCPPNLYWCR